ncbi:MULTISPECIES: stalk domain-containing protein [unclassified Sedimentibacter]|uniref:stalk domain-containing protein n=1 Tax=unclassified Sedimentibacter TaxID=2649220 RepID=UPI0027E1A795|nr:stalk domain-containing protein [Sedimentibacter sp. MB35-C1]WMJ78494.1 stalk domain-containing protein [Sedimentibacter sp. MB35-C1]
MKRFRDIFIGVLIGCMLVATPVLADSILTKIDVVLNGINVQVDGEDVQVDSILYNGSTYLPMRKIAELVGKDVNWTQETKTANIIEKTEIKEGDSVIEQPIENYKVIKKDEDEKLLIVEKDGKEYYSWIQIARLIKEFDFYLTYGFNEFALWNKDGTFPTEFIKVDKDNYIKINVNYYISKDYYETTILPLIK